MDPPGDTRVSDVAGVERQLAELWRQASSKDQAVMRACMLNLIVACADREDLTEATRLVARLSEHYPGRALVVSPKADTVKGKETAPAGMEVYVSAHCHRGPGGAQVCSEQVTFETAGEGWKLVPGSLLRLLVEDCPVYTWWRRSRLTGDPLFRPLVEMSDRFTVDTTTSAEPAAAVQAMSAIASDRSWPGTPGDLAWVRIEPWRELVASLFDPASTRPYLNGVGEIVMTTGGPDCDDDVTIAGAYMAGWLASRLGWQPTDAVTAWRRADGDTVRLTCHEDRDLGRGEIASVRLEAAGDGPRAVFEAKRLPGASDVVRLSVRVEGTNQLPYTHKVARLDEVSLLCGHLERETGDPVFTAALAAAARIAGAPAEGGG